MKFLSILSFIFLLAFPVSSFAKLNVVTTIPDLAALTHEVGKDLVNVDSIARGDQDPHFLEPKPSYTLLVNKADLLIEVGLELEIGWLPVLLNQSRNPNIQLNAPGHLIAAEGARIIEIPTGPIDRSMGDVHPYGNPHYWLNPYNGLMIAFHIADKLSTLDPANATQYQKNYQDFETRLKNKITIWEKEINSIKGTEIITHHKSFSYFADWTGLKVKGFIEPKPGIPPSPSHILKLIDLIDREKIPLIITENYYDPKPSRELAKKTLAKVLVLPTSVGGEAGVDTYESLFDLLIQKIKEAL